MGSFTFVHCADLHIDTPFRGITADNQDMVHAVRESTFEAFRKVAATCKDNQAAFLLIAGDVYDTRRQSVRAVLRFRDILNELHELGIRTFAVYGNHDPANTAYSSVTWPESVHFFPSTGPETVRLSLPGDISVHITGQSHETASERRNLAAGLVHAYSGLNKDGFAIALLHAHAGIGSEHAPYAPCTVSELRQGPFDYWALGHVHTRKIIDTDPYIVYPGNIQGRSFRETGPRGCYVVRVQDGVVTEARFQAVDAIRWEEIDIEINGISTVDAMEEAIYARIDQAVKEAGPRPVICRINLTGRGAIYRELVHEDTRLHLIERVREVYCSAVPFVWLQDMRIRCLPEFDMEQRIRQDDFLAKALSAGIEIGNGDHEAFERLLSDLLANRRIKALGLEWSEQDISEIITEAQMLCMELLEGETPD